MFITFKGKEKEYAYAKESKRVGADVISKSIYLGKVADRALNVFYRPERGFFTFDVETRQYGEPPSTFVVPQKPSQNRSVTFGGSFFLYAFLHKTGMMNLIDTLPFRNKDTVRAMVLFYVLSPLANCYVNKTNAAEPKQEAELQKLSVKSVNIEETTTDNFRNGER